MGRFEICDRNVDAYIYRDCELFLLDNHKPFEPHKEILEMVLIPVEDAFMAQPKLNVSRIGLDVIQKFKITFENSEIMLLQTQTTE